MSTILACTDGSIYAPSVYQYTAWAALRLNAEVRILHALEHHRERAPGVDLSGSLGVEARAHLTEELARLEEAQSRVQLLKGKALLEDAEKQLQAAGLDPDSVTAYQRHGTLIDTIEELEPECDLVVVGKRGEHADFAKGHLGGNLQRVIRSATRPVLVAARAFTPVERFLIAFDGSPSVNKALEYIAESPLLRDLPCHMLRAGHIDEKADYYLQEAATKLRDRGMDVTTHAISGSPDTVMAEAIERENIQLLVMGAYGHSPIRHLIVGSTTTTMVRTCQVPVLMFR